MSLNQFVISKLLQRAKLELESSASWPLGSHVRCAALDLEGRVAFEDNGWVYWADNNGRIHGSRPGMLEKTQ